MNHELLAKRPCVSVMLSLLVSVGTVMNHTSLLGDLLWVMDTQPVSFSILTGVLPSLWTPSVLVSQSIGERISSSHKKVGQDFQKELFLTFLIISL